MNRSQVKQLKEGDKVTFKNGFPAFTVDKEYTVHDSGIGKFIIDDNGLGRPLVSEICLETHFE